MKNFWHTTTVNATNLGPGQFEAIELPGRITASGTNTVIKNGLQLHITDVSIRSVSQPAAPLGPNSNTAGLFVAENGNPSAWLLSSFDAREGWHAQSPFVVEGNESMSRELIIVASLPNTPPGQDRFIVQLAGYIK